MNALSEIYTDSVVVREGDKTRPISRLEALSRKQLELGLKGDQRAAAAAFKTARDLEVCSIRQKWITITICRF